MSTQMVPVELTEAEKADLEWTRASLARRSTESAPLSYGAQMSVRNTGRKARVLTSGDDLQIDMGGFSLFITPADWRALNAAVEQHIASRVPGPYDALDEVPWDSVAAVTAPGGSAVGIDSDGFAAWLDGPRAGQRIPLDAHGPWTVKAEQHAGREAGL